MNEDTSATAALHEIANLLRRRVEQQDEAVERAAQREKASDALSAQSRSVMEESRQSSRDLRVEMEQRREEAKQEKGQADAEQRAFREKLLAEFARHNDLLERIATQLEK